MVQSSRSSCRPAQYLKENTPILTLVKTHPLRLRVDVPETAAVGSVKAGTTLTFTTDAARRSAFTGGGSRVESIPRSRSREP